MTDRTLPWVAEASGTTLYDSEIYGHRGSFSVLIAEVMDKDEAAFIVRAVNAYDDLVAALEIAEAAMAIVEPRSDKAKYLDALAAVRAALIKAQQQ